MARRQSQREARHRNARRPAPSFEGSRLREAIVWSLGVKVFLLIVTIDPFSQYAFDLPKALISRLMEWVLLALLAAAALRWGSSIFPRTRLHLVLVPFVLANVLATALAPVQWLALYGEPSRYLGLTWFVDGLVVYAATAVAVRGGRDWVVLGAWFAAGTAVAVLYELVQKTGHDPFTWLEDPRVRPFATMGNPAMLGQILVVAFGVAAGVAAAPRSSVDARARAGVVVFSLACLVGLVLAEARSTFIGVVAALVVLPLAYLTAARGAARRYAFAGLAGAGALIAAITLLTPLGARVRATLAAGLDVDRQFIYQAALAAFRDRPVLGYGPDGFGVAFPSHRIAGSEEILGTGIFQNSAHSWVLQTLINSGAVGLLALVAALVVFTWVLWARILPSAPIPGYPLLTGFAAYWASGLTTVNSVGVDWWPWLVLGAVAGAVAGRGEPPEHAPFETIASLRPQIVLPVVAVIVGLGGMNAEGASREQLRAITAYHAQRIDVAIPAAQSSVRLDGGRPEYWQTLGGIYFQAGRIREAADAYERATRLAPHQAQFWQDLALTRAAQAASGDRLGGGVEAALAAARRGIAADPQSAEPYATLARVAFELQQFPVGLDAALQAVARYSKDAGFDKLVSDNALAISDRAAARRTVERALESTPTPGGYLALAKVCAAQQDRACTLSSAQRVLTLDAKNTEAQAIVRSLGGP